MWRACLYTPLTWREFLDTIIFINLTLSTLFEVGGGTLGEAEGLIETLGERLGEILGLREEDFEGETETDGDILGL